MKRNGVSFSISKRKPPSVGWLARSAEPLVCLICGLSVITFSKAIGVVGGAVVGSKILCETVVNFGRAYLFSTSLPRHICCAVIAAIAAMHDEPNRQQRVRQIARRVRGELQNSGLQIPAGDSPIIPVILGGADQVIAASEQLKAAGLLVIPIRPPTVPVGSSRLRVTVSSAHTDEEIGRLIDALRRL